MQLLRGFIQSYGRLRQFPFEFPSSFILIFGGNETGKSTFQSFLKSMLCGMKDKGKKGNVFHPEFKKYQPWNDSGKSETVYGGQIILQCKNGEIYEISRNFLKPETDRIFLSPDSEDKTKDFQDEEGLSFLERKFQLSREILEGIYFIPQMSLISHSENVRQVLHNRFSLRFDTSPEKEILLQAITRIKTRQDQIEKVTEIVQQHLEEAQARREKMKQMLQHIHALLSRQALVKQERKSLVQQLYSTYQELKRIRNTVEYAREFPYELLPRLREQSALLTSTHRRLQPLEQEKDSLQQRIVQMEKILHRTKRWEDVQESDLAAIQIYLGDRERKEALYRQKLQEQKALLTSYEEKVQLLKKLESELGQDPFSTLQRLETLLQEREALKELENKAEEKLREWQHALEVLQIKVSYRRVGWFIPIILVGASVGLFLKVNTIFSILTGIVGSLSALLFLWLERLSNWRKKHIQQQLKVAEQEMSSIVERQTARGVDLANLLKNADVKTAEEFYSKVRHFSVLQTELRAFSHSALETEISHLGNSLQSLNDKIAEFSEKLGLRTSLTLASLEPLRKDYLLRITTHQEWIKLQAQFKTLQAQLATLTQEQREYEKNIHEILTKAGVADVSSFEQQAHRREVYMQTTTLLEDFQEFYLRYAGEEKLRIDEATEMTLSQGSYDPASLGKRLKALRNTLLSLEQEFKDIERETQILEAKYDALQEIEESLYFLEKEKKRLQEQWKIFNHSVGLLTAVKEELETSLSPRVNEAFAGILNRLTLERYRLSRIGEDLSLSLKSPEKKGWILAEETSIGALSMAYFSLRLAFLEAMGESGEPLPFFLDDPLVHFDDEHAEEAIKLLVTLRPHHQIFFFSCHEREKKLIQRYVPDAQMLLTPSL